MTRSARTWRVDALQRDSGDRAARAVQANVVAERRSSSVTSDPSRWGTTSLQLQRPENVYFAGEVRPWDEAVFHISSEAVTRGLNVFEGLKGYSGAVRDPSPGGPSRDTTSACAGPAKLLHIPVDFSYEQFVDACLALTEAELRPEKDLYIRATLFVTEGHYGEGTQADLVLTAYQQEKEPPAPTDVGTSTWRRSPGPVTPRPDQDERQLSRRSSCAHRGREPGLHGHGPVEPRGAGRRGHRGVSAGGARRCRVHSTRVRGGTREHHTRHRREARRTGGDRPRPQADRPVGALYRRRARVDGHPRRDHVRPLDRRVGASGRTPLSWLCCESDIATSSPVWSPRRSSISRSSRRERGVSLVMRRPLATRPAFGQVLDEGPLEDRLDQPVRWWQPRRRGDPRCVHDEPRPAGWGQRRGSSVSRRTRRTHARAMASRRCRWKLSPCPSPVRAPIQYQQPGGAAVPFRAGHGGVSAGSGSLPAGGSRSGPCATSTP